MATYPYPVHGHHVFETTGYLGGSDTKWDKPVDFDVDFIVLSDDFGANAGVVLTPDSETATAVQVDGADYTAGPAKLGKLFTATATWSRQFVDGADGFPDHYKDVKIEGVRIEYTDSGPFTLTMTSTEDSNVSWSGSYDPGAGNVGTGVAHFETGVWEADKVTITITSTDPRPCNITGVHVEVDYQEEGGN